MLVLQKKILSFFQRKIFGYFRHILSSPAFYLAAAAAAFLFFMDVIPLWAALCIAGAVGLGEQLANMQNRAYSRALQNWMHQVSEKDSPLHHEPHPPDSFSYPALPRALAQMVGRLKETQRRLDQLWQQNHLVLENVPASIFQLNADLQILYFNHLAQKTFGSGVVKNRSIDAVIRAPVLLDALRKAAQKETEEEAVASEEKKKELSFEIFLGAESRFFRADIVAYRGVKGAKRLLLLLRDRTSYYRTEISQKDFLTNASHELKTPLASITAGIETLAQKSPPDDTLTGEVLDLMRRQTSWMSHLLSDLMLLLKLETHTVDDSSNIFTPFGPVIAEVCKTFLPMAQSRRIRFEMKLDDTLGAVMARTDFYQIARNLVENALHYGNEDSVVRIVLKTYRPGSGPFARRGVLFRLSDQSPGIPPEHIPRLTERFYRVNPHHTEWSSSGLGLSITEAIVNKYDGLLHIESTLNRGSVFSVYLPQEEPPAPDNVPTMLRG